MNASASHRRFLVLTLAILVVAMPAFAEKGGQGKGKGQGHGASKNHGGGPSDSQEKSKGQSKGKGPKKFESSERSSIQRYYRDEYSSSGNCPPGLAKKNNGCMPPGQARKWNVGSALPRDVVIVPLPPTLRSTLVVPAPGYDYGYVDGEVLLFGVSDRIVIDFVAVF